MKWRSVPSGSGGDSDLVWSDVESSLVGLCFTRYQTLPPSSRNHEERASSHPQTQTDGFTHNKAADAPPLYACRRWISLAATSPGLAANPCAQLPMRHHYLRLRLAVFRLTAGCAAAAAGCGVPNPGCAPKPPPPPNPLGAGEAAPNPPTAGACETVPNSPPPAG